MTWRIGVTVALLSLAAPAPAQEPVTAMPNWLAGAWTNAGQSDEWWEEWWTPDKAGIMLGASRSGKQDALGFFEHMRIIRQDGTVHFCALPKGQAGACFKAVSATATEIVFENPAHDFPNRIVYRREGDELFAQISGLDGARAQNWRFRRMN